MKVHSCNVNEADIRVSSATHMVIMLCALYNFTFAVEDRMSNLEFEASSDQVV